MMYVFSVATFCVFVLTSSVNAGSLLATNSGLDAGVNLILDAGNDTADIHSNPVVAVSNDSGPAADANGTMVNSTTGATNIPSRNLTSKDPVRINSPDNILGGSVAVNNDSTSAQAPKGIVFNVSDIALEMDAPNVRESRHASGKASISGASSMNESSAKSTKTQAAPSTQNPMEAYAAIEKTLQYCCRPERKDWKASDAVVTSHTGGLASQLPRIQQVVADAINANPGKVFDRCAQVVTNMTSLYPRNGKQASWSCSTGCGSNTQHSAFANIAEGFAMWFGDIKVETSSAGLGSDNARPQTVLEF